MIKGCGIATVHFEALSLEWGPWPPHCLPGMGGRGRVLFFPDAPTSHTRGVGTTGGAWARSPSLGGLCHQSHPLAGPGWAMGE